MTEFRPFDGGAFIGAVSSTLIVAMVVLNILAVFPLWRLTERAGLSRFWSFAALIPCGAIILVYVIAIRRWPGDDRNTGAPL